MAAHVSKSTRAEQVRRRRLAQSRRRYDSAVSRSSSTVRPLVSRPRRAPGLGTERLGGARGLPKRRRGGLGGWLSGLPFDVRLPALPRVPITWRLASVAMCLLLGAMLLRLLTDRAMFINGINLGGSALVPGEEIYSQSGIAGVHIFWVDPAAVQRNVLKVPGIAGATVDVQWPNAVTIVVTERIPVVTWIENDRTWWVDADGNRFRARQDLPGLLPITVDDSKGKSNTPDETPVPADAIHGALQLRELRPNIELLHYDDLHGLSYQDGRGWRGYFGVGTDMPQKLAVYERLTEDLTGRGIYPKLISVENLDAPYYTK
jgi:hypothetical protein